jgi:cell division protein FtsQ
MRLNLYRTTGVVSPDQKLGFFQRRIIKRGMILMAVASILSGGAAGVFWQDALLDNLIEVSASSGLRLEEIKIKGRLNTDKATLIEAIDIEWYSPMLTLDIQRIHHNVATLGWVRHAVVRRQLPSTLEIKLEERQALALYQDDDGHLVIDRFGEEIKGTRPEDFTHLPVIKGSGAPVEAKSILTMLKSEESLYADVWSLTYQSERRWDVYLRNNIRIQLPEIGTAKAWSKLAEMNRKHKLTQRDIVNIDLRIPDKLVIKPALSKNRKGSTT